MHERDPQPGVIEAYASRFRTGMLDLSAPSPNALPPPRPDSHGPTADLAFSTAGGTVALRAAVASRFRTVGPDDVLITSGASEALVALAATLGGHGRRLAVARGTYPSFTEVATLAGSTLVGLEAMQGAHAALITNPTVPDGQRVDVATFLAHARAAGAVPIVDEVYRHIAVDGDAPEAAVDLDDRAVSVGDLSKPLGLGGLRVGWIVTHDPGLRADIARWLRLLTGGPSSASEALAVEALATFDAQVATHTDRARANAPLVYETLQAAGWTMTPAALGLTVLAYPPHPIDACLLQRLEREEMFLAAGEAFGRPGGFRVGLLTPVPALQRALRLLRTSRTAVLLMRVPRRGIGKSRLAATLGSERTHQLAEAFVTDTLHTIRGGEWNALAACTPAEMLPDAAGRWPDLDMVAQPEGDLGERILAALQTALTRSERAVLIGSDTPDLPRSILDEAFAALDSVDVVIGPSTDGGFYLLGLRATEPALFAGVEWSTASVYERVIANARGLGLRVANLEPWEDIDGEAALIALGTRPGAADRAPATTGALAELGLLRETVRA